MLGMEILREKPQLTKNGAAVSSADAKSHLCVCVCVCVSLYDRYRCSRATCVCASVYVCICIHVMSYIEATEEEKYIIFCVQKNAHTHRTRDREMETHLQ